MKLSLVVLLGALLALSGCGEKGEPAGEAGVETGEMGSMEKPAGSDEKGPPPPPPAPPAPAAGEKPAGEVVGVVAEAVAEVEGMPPPAPPSDADRPAPPQLPTTMPGPPGPIWSTAIRNLAEEWKPKIAAADRPAFLKDFEGLASLTENMGVDLEATRDALVGVLQTTVAEGKLQVTEIDKIRALITQLKTASGDSLDRLLQNNADKWLMERMRMLSEKWSVPMPELLATLAPPGMGGEMKMPPPPPPPPR